MDCKSHELKQSFLEQINSFPNKEKNVIHINCGGLFLENPKTKRLQNCMHEGLQKVSLKDKEVYDYVDRVEGCRSLVYQMNLKNVLE